MIIEHFEKRERNKPATQIYEDKGLAAYELSSASIAFCLFFFIAQSHYI